MMWNVRQRLDRAPPVSRRRPTCAGHHSEAGEAAEGPPGPPEVSEERCLLWQDGSAFQCLPRASLLTNPSPQPRQWYGVCPVWTDRS